jgi:hypothetical protein
LIDKTIYGLPYIYIYIYEDTVEMFKQ